MKFQEIRVYCLYKLWGSLKFVHSYPATILLLLPDPKISLYRRKYPPYRIGLFVGECHGSMDENSMRNIFSLDVYMSLIIIFAYLIPEKAIETEIHVKVLMVVVVKNCIRLPGLPPKWLEIYSRMIDDSMVISV